MSSHLGLYLCIEFKIKTIAVDPGNGACNQNTQEAEAARFS